MFTKADPSATPPVSGSGWDYVIAEFTPEENERVALHHKIEIVDLLKMEGLEIAMKNADEEDAIFLKNLNDTLDASQLKEYLFQLKRKLVL